MKKLKTTTKSLAAKQAMLMTYIKKNNLQDVQNLEVRRAMLTEEIACLKTRLNFGQLPKSDIAELSGMIKLRETELRKL